MEIWAREHIKIWDPYLFLQPLRPVYGDKCLRDQQYMLGVKRLFMVTKLC